MKWAYGVTTIASSLERTTNLLPKTLDCLTRSGFTDPVLFVDDCQDRTEYLSYGLDIVFRYPSIGAFGNWALALWELWIRNPSYDRYAIFQDDSICSRNLKRYLEQTTTHPNTYWNLYTFRDNESLCTPDNQGWIPSDQKGRGAVGLVFTLEGVRSLLQSPKLPEHPRAAIKPTSGIDKVVSEHFRDIGWTEYVHNPSLVQHTGHTSTVRNKRQLEAVTFKGEQFDLTELLDGERK